MAAFEKLDYTRFDFWAIVVGEGIAVVAPQHRDGCLAWLLKRDYTLHSINFLEGIGPAVVTMGKLFHWEEQFGYPLNPKSRNLDALRDGFEFDVNSGQGVVLELLNTEVAHREDPAWFTGLMSIVHEYSRNQLAVGARFFSVLILDQNSSLIGMPYETLAVPLTYSTSARHGNPFPDPDPATPGS
jgi:hypothetical protein